MTAHPHTPWPRLVVVALALAAAVSVLLIAFLWPTVTSSVSSLPIAVVAPSPQADAVEQALEDRSPGTFAVTTAATRNEAVDLIESRAVYGALVLGPQPEVLTASAASPPVAQLLAALAPALQAQATAAAQAQGIELPAPITVTVTDVVPLAAADPRGAAIAASSFPVVLGGMLGGIIVSIVVVGAWRRVAAVLVYSVAGGAALVGILQGWFGVLQGDALVTAGAMSLALLSISSVIVGAVSIVGRPGIALGPIVFLLVANPISAAAQPIEFLAQPWGAVGQWFPPGAAATLVRELSYFPAANTLFPWLVLASWAAGGLLLSLIGHFRSSGAASAAALAEAVE
jgi:hypothetical protein